MEREIFKYWNGNKDVYCDPMALEFKYLKACEKVNIDAILSKFFGPEWLANLDDPAKLAEQGITPDGVTFAMKQIIEGTGELVPVLAETFGVKMFDEDQENGMMASELIRAYVDWMEFKSGVKKNTDLNADSPPSGTLPSQPTHMSINSDITTTKILPSVSPEFRSPKGSHTL